jgi:hypothetical protein
VNLWGAIYSNIIFPLLFLVLLDPGSKIRDGKKQDPGSGINIPDPPHCLHWKDVCAYSCAGIGSASLTDEDDIGENFFHFFMYRTSF